MDPLRALVFNATRNSGLAAIRNLTRAGFEVVAADDRRLPFGLHSRYSPPYLRHPTPDHPAYADRVVQLIREVRPDAVLPLNTRMVEVLSRHVAERGPIPGVSVPPLPSLEAAGHKRRVVEECMALGIPCPRLLDREAAIRVLNGAAPSERAVVVKPVQDLGQGTGVTIVRAATELERVEADCRSRFGETVIQEFIPGPQSSMLSLALLFGRDSELLGYFMSRKVHTWPLETGTTALAETIVDPEILDRVLAFFRTWAWHGPVEIELKVDPRDGIAKIIEMNPRHRGKVAFATACGVPLLAMSALEAAGQRVAPRLTYGTGLRTIVPIAYGKVLTVELWRGGRRKHMISEAWSLLRGGAVQLEPDRRDPLPVLGKWLLEAGARARGRA